MATLPAATGIEQLGRARRASRWRAELRLFLGAYVAYNVARWVFAGGVGAEADAGRLRRRVVAALRRAEPGADGASGLRDALGTATCCRGSAPIGCAS